MPICKHSFIAAAFGLFAAGTLPALAVEGPDMRQTSSQPTQQEVSQEIQPMQIAVTGDMVERFLNSYPELVKLSDTLASIAKPTNAAPDETDVQDDPIYALGSYLGDPKASEQINKVLEKYKFASYSEWANAAHSVALAAEASEADSGLDDLEGQKQQAIKDLEADDTLSADDKKSARVELEQQFAALTEFVPLPGNREAVKPYLDRIKSLGTTNN
jgi:hypothetical protein